MVLIVILVLDLISFLPLWFVCLLICLLVLSLFVLLNWIETGIVLIFGWMGVIGCASCGWMLFDSIVAVHDFVYFVWLIFCFWLIVVCLLGLDAVVLDWVLFCFLFVCGLFTFVLVGFCVCFCFWLL